MPLLVAIVVAVQTAIAAQGRVVHADLPVPGATITATKGEQTVTVTTDEDGVFRFPDLEPGKWVIKVEMRGFVTVTREIDVPPSAPAIVITLTMRTYAEMIAAAAVKTAWPALPASSTDTPEILNGTVVNGAATPFALPRAVGNNRPRGPSVYSGALTGNFGSSAWNAGPFSFGGSPVPSPDYWNGQMTLTFGGPFRIPFSTFWFQQVRVTYDRRVHHNATTRSALVPTLDERRGILSDRVIPVEQIVPQATALLELYPQPTGAIANGANYQRSLLSATTSDRAQVDANRSFGSRTQVGGSVSFQRSISDSRNLFDFVDRSRQSTINATFNWTRRIGTRLNVRANYQLTLTNSTTTPFFANRINVSGDAGIMGNAQDPLNWGPPTIVFPDFIDLSGARYQRSRRNTHVLAGQAQWRRGRHNVTFGGDVRMNVIHLDTHPDPRGTLTFTGAATGNAFADFLLGIPTTSSIAFGNIGANVRGGQFSAFVEDDFRIAPGLTVNLGLRWEYESPYSERGGRMANLDVLPDFSAVKIVTGNSLVHRDPLGIEPRLGVSWRPLLASSLVITGGYGVYRNLGVYQSIGTLLAQQPPFSNSYSIQSSSDVPLTLANPFPGSVASSNTFAVDPNFKTAVLHSWQLTMQRELPWSLAFVVAYLGSYGTSLAQAFLPNPYAPGASNPCESCPTGFTYLTAGGTSTRNAAQFIVRRRLHAGLTATMTYTLSKSRDNASTFSNTNVSPGSLSIAQNWLDLEAERGPSSFDQRHLAAVEFQYTTGVGILGGTLVDSFWGKLYKDWTIAGQLNAGSGLPVTPLVFVAVPGTGVVGIRPALTGESIAPPEPDSYANAAAFTMPAPGTWGNAGRNAIRGPSTFSFDMSVARTFRFNRRFNLEWRLMATNVLNRVTFTAIDRIITSPQFGRATSAGEMRRILTNFIFRF